MFGASRERGAKYFYLKAEDGIVTGYETDIIRSNEKNLLYILTSDKFL